MFFTKRWKDETNPKLAVMYGYIVVAEIICYSIGITQIIFWLFGWRMWK